MKLSADRVRNKDTLMSGFTNNLLDKLLSMETLLMDRNTALAITNVFCFIFTIVVNTLANVLPINGLNTGEVSALYPSLFTPAGFTFSIWSVIYLLLLGFIVFQWRYRNRKYFSQLSALFITSCLLNGIWILVWHHLLIFFSVIVMILLLFVLIRIFLLLEKHKPNSGNEMMFVRLPFTLYLAWISVATIANISAFLITTSWQGAGLSPATWTIVMIVVAFALATFMIFRFKKLAFAAVVAWALVGIAANKLHFITEVAAMLAVLLIVMSIYSFWKSSQHTR
jgi:benzodiazapine receptor